MNKNRLIMLLHVLVAFVAIFIDGFSFYKLSVSSVVIILCWSFVLYPSSIKNTIKNAQGYKELIGYPLLFAPIYFKLFKPGFDDFHIYYSYFAAIFIIDIWIKRFSKDCEKKSIDENEEKNKDQS